MPQPPLPKAKRDRIVELHNLGYKQQRIADELGVATGTVSKFVRGLPADPLLKDIPVERDMIAELAVYHREKFDELQHKYRQWIGDTGRRTHPKPKPSSRKVAAVCNDLHAPFHREDALVEFIRRNKGADECWVVGDVLDLFCVSRYEKREQHFSPVEEFQAGQNVMNQLAENFPVVRVMHGNHDDRAAKYLTRLNIPPQILEFFRLMCPEFPSPLAKICSHLTNVEMMEPKQVDFAKYPFVHQIGDCVLSHAERFSKLSLKATADVVDWLKSYAEPMGIVKDVKFIVQAHTHAAGKGWFGYGVCGIEAGCMSRVPDYAGNPQLRGGSKPTVCGYSVIVQNEGVTDRNASNFVELA